MYIEADTDRVHFINAVRHLGLPLGQIRELLGVWDGGICWEIRDEFRQMVAAILPPQTNGSEPQTFPDGLRSPLMHLHDLPARDDH